MSRTKPATAALPAPLTAEAAIAVLQQTALSADQRSDLDSIAQSVHQLTQSSAAANAAHLRAAIGYCRVALELPILHGVGLTRHQRDLYQQLKAALQGTAALQARPHGEKDEN
jgi:hypothetical protein